MKYVKWLLGLISESKKVRALIVGLVMLAAVPIGAKLGFDINEGQVDKALLLLVGYMAAQGLADFGKEAKKVGDGE